jgi:hypothetical protein
MTYINTPQLPFTLSATAGYRKRQLHRSCWCILLALLGYEWFGVHPESVLDNIGATLMTITALYPALLWCSGRAQGMPIFPFFALTHTWTHALPMVTNHPTVMTYSADSRFLASLTVAGFLAIGTWVWFGYVSITPSLPHSYRLLPSKKGDNFFFSILIVAVVYTAGVNGGWLFQILPGSLFTIIRSAVLGLMALASFILAYRLGNQELSRKQSILFILLLASYMVADAISLLLVGASSVFIIAIIAYIISSRKIPVLPIAIAMVCLTFLHYGKSEMRTKYWAEGNHQVQIWEYPAWYSEWTGYSLTYIGQKELGNESEEKSSFVERSSVIQMLLLAQAKSPKVVPYMNGETYSIVPQLLVPRILNPNKLTSHEGTTLLSMHYGLQTREMTEKTTIGWGLVAEAYANFGVLGCAGLAFVLGTLYGKVSRWTINAPILSAQSLLGVLFMTFAFQSEWSAGVYAASFSQAGMVLIIIVGVLMKTYPVPPTIP